MKYIKIFVLASIGLVIAIALLPSDSAHDSPVAVASAYANARSNCNCEEMAQYIVEGSQQKKDVVECERKCKELIDDGTGNYNKIPYAEYLEVSGEDCDNQCFTIENIGPEEVLEDGTVEVKLEIVWPEYYRLSWSAKKIDGKWYVG
jgi:hypothetical protein